MVVSRVVSGDFVGLEEGGGVEGGGEKGATYRFLFRCLGRCRSRFSSGGVTRTDAETKQSRILMCPVAQRMVTGADQK